MGPVDAIKIGLTRPFDIKGRATRSMFWWFAGAILLFQPIAWIASALSLSGQTASFAQTGMVSVLLMYCMICFWSAGMRRFNDTWVGWVILPVLIIPIASAVAVLACLAFVLWIAIVGTIAGFQPNTESHTGLAIVAYLFYPSVLLFAFAANAIFWLLPSASKPNEVPS